MKRLPVHLLCLVIIAHHAIVSCEAADLTFHASFDAGVAPDLAAGAVKARLDGAATAPAAGGQALRTGRDGETWQSLTYTLTPDAYAAQEAGQLRPTFPLREGSVEFDFRADGWAAGTGDEVMLLHISHANGTLYVRVLEREGERFVQAIYGLLGSFPDSDRLPKHFRMLPLPDTPEAAWHHVRVAWNSRWLRLEVDGEELVGSLANYMKPEFDGSRLEFGIPYPSSRSHHIEGHTLIDNVAISDEGPPSATEGEQHLPLVSVGPIAEGIVVDGTLDEPEWSRATLATGFLTIGSNLYASHQPQVLMAHDDERLYAAVRTPIHGDAGLVTQARTRDDPVWQDDAVELHLDPTPETPDAYQFVVNSAGTVFDQRYDAEDRTASEGPSWDCEGLRVGSRASADEWTLELAVPFASLGMSAPEDGDEWLFNACETRIGLGAQCLSAVRTYAERSSFGRLVFADGAPVLRMPRIGALSGAQLAAEAARVGEGSVELLARGRRYDDTADTFFTLFTKSAEVGGGLSEVLSADAAELGRSGIVDLEATAGGRVIYRARLPYEAMADVEIETMRVEHEQDGPRLIVRTVQPFTRGVARQARVRLLGVDDAAAAEAVMLVAAQKMDVPVDLSAVEPGDYQVRLEVLDAHGEPVQVAEHDRAFEMYADPTPWAGCGLGLSDEVPSPWTPMEASEDAGAVTVRCWNREYAFGARSLLPSQITSGGREYLAGPVAVVLEADGAPVAVASVTHRIVSLQPKRCLIASECVTGWGTLRAETSVEFDGFIWTDLTLAPAQASTVERLAVRWAMPRERSTLLHAGYRSLTSVGATPEEFAKSLDQSQGPLWVGDEHGGIALAVESFEHWRNTDAQRQAVVRRANGPANVTLSIIDQPGPMTAPTQFGFCLQPTPVRPRPGNYRELRAMQWFGVTCHEPDYAPNYSPWTNTNRYMSAPIWCVTDEDVRWFDEVAHEREHRPCFTYEGLAELGMRSSWYSAYRCTARNSPGFIWGGNAWRKGDRDELYGKALQGYYNDMVAVCKTRDFQDWYLWRLDRSRREQPIIDGIYLDLMAWDACTRADHGHGWTDAEGNRHHSWPLREHREFLLRLYTYLKRDDPQTPILLHLSGQAPKIMAYSFCDYLWTGELWINEVQRDRSYKALGLDAFRAELLPEPWGPGKLWISQLGRALTFLPAEERAKGLDPSAYRHLLGMLLVHDSLPNSGRIEGKEDVWRALDRFGLATDDRLIGYWEGDDAVRLQPERDELVATAWVKADRALVVVLNNTDEPLAMSVQFDAGRLFGTPRALTVEDGETGEALGDGPRVEAEIGARDFRMFVVRAG